MLRVPPTLIGKGSSISRRSILIAGAGSLLSACGGGMSIGDLVPGSETPAGGGTPQGGTAIGTGQVRVGLLLPLSAPGNAGIAATSMRNAAELALAEFNSPDVQLLVKDDAGTAPGAQLAAQQALDEGAEIILGPLFAATVGPVAQVARPRNVPIIAFSTDANVAAPGVYLLSFLPESDVDRITDYAVRERKRSFGALVPDNAYGSVVEGAFKQVTARRGARVVLLEHYGTDPATMQRAVQQIGGVARNIDALLLPDGADALRTLIPMLKNGGIDSKRVQFLGTGLWDDPQVFANPDLQGGWYAAPDSTGFRNFSGRYRQRYGQDPVRTASLAYDAVALVAALAKTQGAQRFSPQVLTNPSGFTGIDGLFRFRSDGTNQRGLAVLRVTPTGGQIIGPPPKSFTGA